MEDKEYNRERLRQARLERLGTNSPQCILCPEDDPSCLERHHLSGRTFSDDSIIVYRNYHRKLSDKQKEHPPTAAADANTVERLGRLLLGITDGLELLKVPIQLVKSIRQGGLHLIEYG